MTEYYIPNHVHFVVDGDVAVFLDLRADEYSMLVGAKATAFNSMVSRTAYCKKRVLVVDDHDLTLDSEVVSELLKHELLITKAPRDALRPVACIPLPESSLIDSQEYGPTHMGARDILHFFLCCLITKCRLRFEKIEEIVSGVERRKRFAKADGSLDMEKAARLVRIFHRLRPLLPQDNMCLFDSLALLHFLSKYDCFPNWVFAVRLEPWEAHCWIQHGTVAFNENTDRASAFLPMMTV